MAVLPISVNVNKKNATPPQNRAAREITPGRPISGMVNETQRRDWEQPGNAAEALTAAVSSALAGVGAGNGLIWVQDETPAGTVNGTNTAFTIQGLPASGTFQLYINGLRQRTSMYSLTGMALTVNDAPQIGDSMAVEYGVGAVAQNAGPGPGVSGGTATVMPRMVWAHHLPPASPFYDDGSYYGSNQPLCVLGTSGVTDATTYADALNAGVTHLAVDLFLSTAGMASRLTAADALGLKLAPCLDTSYEGGASASQVALDIEAAISTYLALIPGHVSAAMYNGKPVIMTYGDLAHSPAAVWALVKASVVGQQVSFFGDIGGAYLAQGSAASRQTSAAALSASFDQISTFGPEDPGDGADSALTAFLTSGKPWAWTSRPGYHKVTGNAGTGNTIGHEDSQGTGLFQTRWQDVLAKGSLPLCEIAFICTWSDFGEQTAIVPSTDMAHTLSDLNAFYSAQFRGLPCPFTDARQYLTVQQSGYLGGSVLLECTVINPTASRLQVLPVVQNCNSAAISGQFGGPVAPMSVTRYTLNLPVDSTLLSQTGINGVNALKVYSVLSNDVTGVQIAATLSARTALFNAAAPSGGGQALYYSVGSRYSTGYTPSGSVNITSGGVRTVNITPAGGGRLPQSLEVLHDTRRGYIYYLGAGATNATITGSPFPGLSVQADNRNDSTDHGVYIIREISQSGETIYSDPLPVTHNG